MHCSAQDGPDVIISEIMQNPDAVSDSEGEYIELYNSSSSSVSLAGWTLTVDSESDELNGGTISPGGFALLCVDGSPSDNGGIDNCTIDYPDRISLKNEGSTIILKNGAGTEIDRVGYDGGSVWPDPRGASLEYVGPPTGDTNAAANWQVATTRRGEFDGSSGDLGSPTANSHGGQLPVELTGFHVTATAKTVTLTWTTATESNNAGFVVEHRPPGTGEWKGLEFADGHGTTHSPSRYRLSATVDVGGTHRFRLKQVDTNGARRVVATRRIQIAAQSLLSLDGPNPVRSGERLSVVVSAEASDRTQVAIYNVLGQRVRTLASPTGGSVRRIEVTTRSLASGTYFVCATAGTTREARRFTVVE